ncbi:hypothetical protein ACA910_006040 [Epithemia clementina (nom. ined.)]
MAEHNRPTYRIEEVDEEDESKEIDNDHHDHNNNMLPRSVSGGRRILDEDLSSIGGDDDISDDIQTSSSRNNRLTFSEIAKKIQNPGARGGETFATSTGPSPSAPSSNNNPIYPPPPPPPPSSASPARNSGPYASTTTTNYNNKPPSGNKRLFGGGSSDAADQALSMGAVAAPKSVPAALPPLMPSAQQQQRPLSGEFRHTSSDSTRRSGSSAGSNRRKYLQTIHSERSLKSEASSGNKSANAASNSEPRSRLKSSKATPRGPEGLDGKGGNNNTNKSLGSSNSPNRRALMRRAPGAVKPGMPNETPSKRNASFLGGHERISSLHNTGGNSNNNNNNRSPNTKRATLLASRLASRTTNVKGRLSSDVRAKAGGALGVIGLGNSGTGAGGDNHGGSDTDALAGGGAVDKQAAARRYKPGDSVLVCNQQSRWSTLVNRYGFPPGEGQTPEEMRGPYIYAMATVKQVHFEEFAAYYTVVRADTGAEHRADAEFMEPLKTPRGQQAAYRAALQSSLEQGVIGSEVGLGHTGDHPYAKGAGEREMAHSATMSGRNKCVAWMENACVVLLLPFLCIYDFLYFCATVCLTPVGNFLLRNAKLVLMGLEPYACQLRLTVVNFIVLCSIWYMFIDQARLFLFKPRADDTLAVINFIVFLVLLLELLFEVFIRPDGYKKLIISEKAFSPQTVRFINAFHFVVETFSLLIFIPEFYCLFSHDSCSTRFKFSFFNAALVAVTGPTRAQSTYGRAYFALVRLRIFGVVRHWKNMWITNTFLMGRKRDAGWLSSIFPPRASHKDHQQAPALKRQDSNLTESGVDGTKGGGESNKGGEDENDQNQNHDNKDQTLTNASNIGTALMVTNSYRAISLLWVITGLFPILTFSWDASLINSLGPTMTEQLQATNMIASDTSTETCQFLFDSVHAWINALVPPDFDMDPSDPYLIDLKIEPQRCSVSLYMCDPAEVYTLESENLCDNRHALGGKSKQEMADYLGVRVGSIVTYDSDVEVLPFLNETTKVNASYSVTSYFDQNYTIATAAFTSFVLQLILLAFVLGGLTVLRRDAEVLVLFPLRRMLKIVARYAKNPLVQPRLNKMRFSRRKLTQRVISRDDDSTLDSSSDDSSSCDNGKTGGGAWRNEEFALGSYETEQLIAAVTKITDLLRKCWGVAGADIISTNLATREGALTEVFNPTVPGKSVYALFAFAAINEFDHALRNLGGDVMILINDVASVLHGEVYRWGFGDSGQCNKNLGGAFLMVFRIGLVKEVIKKLEQATSVIFSGSKASQTKVSQLTRRRANKIQHQTATLAAGQTRRNSSNTQSSGSSSPRTVASAGSSENNPNNAGAGFRPAFRGEGVAAARAAAQSYRRLLKVQRTASVKAMSLSLASLPGISTFTDRAVIGMLKSFASIHRDKKLRSWNNDFRLGAGVGAFTVSMIYGMDAGWAVEGAVGSNYKIDATYLSPHVNMASRMMSACKQYGVSILLSQAVQELMSDVARSKLRHLDTVTVKGSSIQQKIFTYDARHQGADFFLHYKTDEQADIDADLYTPKIWNEDPDLHVMRQHITDEFLTEFEEGRKMFLLGEWTVARRRLEKANELMVENAIESGFLESELEEIMNQAANPVEAAEELKRQNGDGPSQYLLNFMQSYGNVPPQTWEGWHPLNRK